jgi:hypothetical protein
MRARKTRRGGRSTQFEGDKTDLDQGEEYGNSTRRDRRYGNWYRGDDDLFTHCLILRSGRCWLLRQGLRPVTLRSFKAAVSQFKKLTAAIKTIPASWATATYVGYNFEPATATEIAVYCVNPGGVLPRDGAYFVAPPNSDLAIRE